MPNGGLIAGYNCGSSINAGLLPGYRGDVWGVHRGHNIECLISSRNKQGQVVAAETSNKQCVAHFWRGGHTSDPLGVSMAVFSLKSRYVQHKEPCEKTKNWLRNKLNIIENHLKSTKKGAALCPRIGVT